MSNYIVTGCAGFIGSKVSQMLLDRGDAVIGLDSFTNSYDPKLKKWRLGKLSAMSDFRFCKTDISDSAALGLYEFPLSGYECEAVINFAGDVGVRPSVEDPEKYYKSNVIGVLNLLEFCRRHGVGKFVQASTSSLYAGGTAVPYYEDADTSRPLSPYAATKKAAEVLIHSYHYLHGISASVLRYSAVYGPVGRPDMSIFRFIRQISEGETFMVYGDGTQQRDFIFVDDVARGTLEALKLPGFEVVNLGGGRPVVLNDVIGVIERLTSESAKVKYAPAHPADALIAWAAIDRASKLLGWSPQVAIEEGLERTLQWYRKEREMVLAIDMRL